MSLKEIINRLSDETSSQAEIKALIDKEDETKLDNSTQAEFYKCFKLLIDKNYQDEALILAKKYNFTGLEEYTEARRYTNKPLLLVMDTPSEFKLAESLIKLHLDKGGKLADYREKNLPILYQVLHWDGGNNFNETCYQFAKFLIEHGGADKFIDYNGQPASPYSYAFTLRMIQLLEENGYKPIFDEMFSKDGFMSMANLIRSIDEDALIYLFEKYFMTRTPFDSSECPRALEVLTEAIREDKVKLTEYLLKKGVDPNKLTKFPREQGISNPEIVLLLEQYQYSEFVGEKGKERLLKYWSDNISRDLRKSDHAYYLGAPFKYINSLLQGDINVAPNELENLDKIDLSYLLENGLYHLAYLAHPPQTEKMQKQYQILLKDSKPPVYFRNLDKLSEVKQTTELKEAKSPAQQKLQEFLDTRIETQKEAFNPREAKGIELYQRVSDQDFWMLCVDGEQIKRGPIDYDSREYGCIRSLQNAYKHMLSEFVNKPLTKDILKAIHKDVTARVANLGLESHNPGGEFRTSGVSSFVLFKQTMTPKGLEEINLMQQDNGNFILVTERKPYPSYKIATKNVVDEKKSFIPEINKIVDKILEKYHQKMEDIKQEEISGTLDATLLDEKRLYAIASCIQELERTHPFTDANCRTFTVTLNLLLLQNGFCPTLLKDPNMMDGLDVASFVKEIKQGMINFRHFIAHQRYPCVGTTREIMEFAMLQGRSSCTNFICDTNKLKELNLTSRKFVIPNLHWAIQFNNLPLANTLLESKVNIQNKVDINMIDQLKNTALIIAAFNGNSDIAKLLLSKNGIDIHIEGQFGLTAYDCARLRGHTELAQTLLDQGAKPKEDSFYADKQDLLDKFGYDAVFAKKPAPTAGKELKAGDTSLLVTVEKKSSQTTSANMLASMTETLLQARTAEEFKTPPTKSSPPPSQTVADEKDRKAAIRVGKGFR